MESAGCAERWRARHAPDMDTHVGPSAAGAGRGVGRPRPRPEAEPSTRGAVESHQGPAGGRHSSPPRHWTHTFFERPQGSRGSGWRTSTPGRRCGTHPGWPPPSDGRRHQDIGHTRFLSARRGCAARDGELPRRGVDAMAWTHPGWPPPSDSRRHQDIGHTRFLSACRGRAARDGELPRRGVDAMAWTHPGWPPPSDGCRRRSGQPPRLPAASRADLGVLVPSSSPRPRGRHPPPLLRQGHQDIGHTRFLSARRGCAARDGELPRRGVDAMAWTHPGWPPPSDGRRRRSGQPPRLPAASRADLGVPSSSSLRPRPALGAATLHRSFVRLAAVHGFAQKWACVRCGQSRASIAAGRGGCPLRPIGVHCGRFPLRPIAAGLGVHCGRSHARCRSGCPFRPPVSIPPAGVLRPVSRPLQKWVSIPPAASPPPPPPALGEATARLQPAGPVETTPGPAQLALTEPPVRSISTSDDDADPPRLVAKWSAGPFPAMMAPRRRGGADAQEAMVKRDE
jgi:hypothetical protein